MTTFIVDQTVTTILGEQFIQKVIERVRKHNKDWIEAEKSTIREIALRLFPNVSDPKALAVSVTIENAIQVSAFAGKLTYAAPVLIEDLCDGTLVAHIQHLLTDVWNASAALTPGQANEAASRVYYKLQKQTIDNPPTCPGCGHIAVNKNGFWKCLNCGESLGSVDGTNNPVPAAVTRCPECEQIMERVGTYKKCPKCGHSDDPS